MKRTLSARWVPAVACAAMLGTLAPNAHADTNVCVELLEPMTLSVPEDVWNCTWSWWQCGLAALPECCTTATCKLFPICGAKHFTQSVVESFFAGDVYCHLSGRELWDHWLANTVALAWEATTG